MDTTSEILPEDKIADGSQSSDSQIPDLLPVEQEAEPKTNNWKFRLFGILGLIVILLLACMGCIYIVQGIQNVRGSQIIKFESTIEKPKGQLYIEIPYSEIEIIAEERGDILIQLEGPDYMINRLDVSEGLFVDSIGQKFGSALREPAIFMVAENNTKGKIYVPNDQKFESIEIKSSDASQVKLTGYKSKLTLKLSNSSEVSADDQSSILDPQLEIAETSKVSFGSCKGELSASLSGTSRFEAKGCDLSNMSVELSDVSEFVISSGSIENADLNLSGASKINMPKVQKELNQKISGTATVDFVQ